MIQINNTIRNYVKSKKKYSDIYSNKVGVFTGGNFRSKVFSIKSFLSPDAQKDSLLYLPLNYSKIIARAYADYTVWAGVKHKFASSSVNKKFDNLWDQLNISNKLYNMSIKQSYMGYGILRVRNQGGEIKLENIPVKNYFPKTDNLSVGSSIEDVAQHNIVSLVKDDNLNSLNISTNKNTVYAHVDSYIKNEDGKWVWNYEIHKFDGKREFDQSSLIITKENSGEILDYLPLFIFNNDILNDEDEDDTSTIWNEKVSNDVLGDSDMVDIMELLQEVNDRTTQISVEFIKHLNSKISIPQSVWQSIMNEKRRKNNLDIDLDNIDTQDVWIFFERLTHGQGEQPAQYISRDSGYISQAMDYKKSLLRDIASITQIPVTFLWLEDKWWTKKATTLQYEMDRFYKRVAQKRNSIRSTLKKLFAYIVYLSGEKYELPSVEFVDIIPKDFSDNAKVYMDLYNAWLASKQTALGRIYDWNSQEVEDEIEKLG